MTSKIRSAKPRTKVRKIVKYQENLPDCYNGRKEQYNLMKNQSIRKNLGTEEDKKEVKIGANLERSVK